METSNISMVTNFKQRPSKSVEQMARGKDSDILQNEPLWSQSWVSGEVLLDLHVFYLKYFVWCLWGTEFLGQNIKKKKPLLRDII